MHGQWLKTEFGTSRRKRFDDARDVIANEDEARDFGICFNDTAECRLGVAGDGVGFVENDDFEGGIGIIFGGGGIDVHAVVGGCGLWCVCGAAFGEESFFG